MDCSPLGTVALRVLRSAPRGFAIEPASEERTGQNPGRASHRSQRTISMVYRPVRCLTFASAGLITISPSEARR
jgi:hypothetical protein